MNRNSCRVTGRRLPRRVGLLGSAPSKPRRRSPGSSGPVNQVLEWNQVFIDTLIATNTANSSSQRLGAIVHTAIFDALQRYRTALHANLRRHDRPRAARRAGQRSSLRRTLRWSGCFPSRQPALDESYAASLAALSDECERRRSADDDARARARIERGIDWGTEVAQAVLAWRSDRRVQRRATLRSPVGRLSASGGRRRRRSDAMSAQGLAFTVDVRPGEQHPVRAWTTARSDQRHVRGRFQRRQGARSQDGIDAHRGPDGACGVLGGQRQRPLESGGEPDCARQPSVHVRQQPAPRGPEHRDGRHGVHDLERQAILRRRSERSDLAAGDRRSRWRTPTAIRTRLPIRTGCRSSTRRRTRNTLPGIPASTARLRPFSSATSADDRRSR